ncbi:2-amino-4-hydroxy-6-hydroxymethyldihydropteridinepyrophosphokinase [hydrothermal vent metagenome]|uniref:2-amino-4-hydroxy-6-hydroxymethyldihydropteridine diphosphokinase n=1 Tax=hydrothermal vent metagenome TaxID=652676 RepID=A0A3B0X0B7_9ZZZZ
MRLSSVYESESVGFKGENFYNMVIVLHTDEDVWLVSQALRQIEDAHGRDRSGPKFASRTLDLDLLLYDNQIINENNLQIPRNEILERAFVLWPMAEVAPDLRHPVVKQRYAELWQAFDKSGEKLEPVEFKFD